MPIRSSTSFQNLAAPLRRLASLPLALMLGGLPVLALLLALGPQTALAGGTVTNCADDSEFSALLAGGGTIVFNCGPGPVSILVTSQHVITQPTTIDGGGQVTLDGGGATRFFSVTAGARLSLANLTLYHGQVISDAGGAIYNNGTLTLLNTTLLSNTANGASPDTYHGAGGGIYSADSGRLTVSDSFILDNESQGGQGGAGIFSRGALTVTGSTFRGNVGQNRGDGGGLQTAAGTALIVDSVFISNTAGYGGAIDNDGADALTLINSQLIDNLGIFDGGAMDIDSDAVQTYISDTFAYNRSPNGWGGAVWNASALTIRDSVFYGNVAGRVISDTDQAGGAIYHSSGALTITNSTLYNNFADKGGGIYADEPVTMLNSTLVSNTAVLTGTGGNLYLNNSPAQLKNTLVANGAPDNCFSVAITPTSLGHNLESANSCGLSASGDITNTNPLLGPLGNNGGPTLTLALLPGSPAIDHGDNSGCPARDQRGGARPFNATCDIGAYEFGALVARLFLPMLWR